MNPMFFGDSSSPLFGVYHPPTENAFINKAVLICSPIAHEHIRSYKTLRNIAKTLSKKGYHVFRFDYTGVGDSSGDLINVSLDRWIEDVSLAYKELLDVSGVKKISLLGVRIGGALVLKSKIKSTADKIVLWDPVISGERYVKDMSFMHREMLVDTMRFRKSRESDLEENEIVGFKYNKELLVDFSKINVEPSEICIDDVYTCFSKDNSEYDSLYVHEKCIDKVVKTNEPSDWGQVRKIGDLLMNTECVQTIIGKF